MDSEQAAVCDDALRCLRAMHSEGIRHGDLDPSNIIVTEDGSVKVIDFGASKVGASKEELEQEEEELREMLAASVP